jgi:hypothetical protein
MCNSSLVVPPLIAVANATTGETLCGATIAEPEGNDASALVPGQVIDAGAGCEYEVGLSMGTYDLAVSMPGFQTAQVTVSVLEVPCGQAPPAQAVIQVKLAPL